MLQRARHGDDGAVLVLVLILITIMATVMGVILDQDDTATRTSESLRDQASTNYSADGAAQAVLTALTQPSGIDCSSPGSTGTKQLGSTTNPFYIPASSQQGPINAFAQCTADPINGKSVSVSQAPPSTSVTISTPPPVTTTANYLGQGDATLPSYAVLTTGNTASDFGFSIADSASNKTVCVENGSVGSNSNIDASSETLAVRLAGTGTVGGPCSTGSGSDANGNKLVISAAGLCKGGVSAFTPTACTAGSAQIATPAAPAFPGGTPTTNPTPVCDSTGTYAAFRPGLYTNVALLNTPCTDKKGNPAAAGTEWFSPGWYYFNYGSTAWSWPTSRLVAGTPIDKTTGVAMTGLDPGTPGTLSKLANLAASPGACMDPSSGSGVNGVAMVFGGTSTVAASHSGASEICASSPAGSPPVAVYAVPTGVTAPVPAQSMCNSGCPSTASLITTDSSGLTQIYIKGYTYAPQVQILLNVKNTAGQVFNWGVIARDLKVSINGSSPSQAVIKLPNPNTGVGVQVTTSQPAASTYTSVTTPPPSTTTTYTIRYVSVWTCTVSSLQASGQTRCPTSGTPNVQARVLVTPGSPIQVLSWNTLH